MDIILFLAFCILRRRDSSCRSTISSLLAGRYGLVGGIAILEWMGREE